MEISDEEAERRAQAWLRKHEEQRGKEQEEMPMFPIALMAKAGVNLTSGKDVHGAFAVLRPWWPMAALRFAAEQNNAKYYKSLLMFLLRKLEVDLPAGILSPDPGKPGRPMSEQTLKIFFAWEQLGRPSLTTLALARTFFGPEFTKADGAGRKKLRNRCRNAVQRIQGKGTK